MKEPYNPEAHPNNVFMNIDSEDMLVSENQDLPHAVGNEMSHVDTNNLISLEATPAGPGKLIL